MLAKPARPTDSGRMDDARRAFGSNRAPVNPPTPSRWWLTAMDGTRPWGSIDVWPNRYGFRKYRLVVFPPGIGSTERRYVRLARSWPTWGAMLWLILVVALSGHGWSTLIFPTAAFLLSGAIAVALTQGAHSNTRTMIAALIDGYDDPATTARYARLERLTRTLVTADSMRSRGELTIVEHEAVWWSVYEALEKEGRQHV
jgi:hypothetical protein